MRLSSQKVYLALTAGPEPQRTVGIFPTLQQALTTWSSGTRVSPMWGLTSFGGSRSRAHQFRGAHILMFIGPVSPARLWTDLDLASRPGGLQIWLTAGSFNIVARLDAVAAGTARELEEWASDAGVPSEQWSIVDGKITNTSCSRTIAARDPAPFASLSNLAKRPVDISIQPQVDEFCALMASALGRARRQSKLIYDDLLVIEEAIEQSLPSSSTSSSRDILDWHATLATINAALSRFTSQSFSGTSPIMHTECHYWTHSLLGTGSANLALAKLVKFIEERLGEARLPERVQQLKDVTSGVPDFAGLVDDNSILVKDHLAGTLPPELSTERIVPLISYFSGRDGYSSQLQTISAPLSSIARANSIDTNILTITHELSHIFVEGILGYLYPDPEDAAAHDELVRLLSIKPPQNFANMLEAAKRLLAEALIVAEGEAQNRTIEFSGINSRLIAIASQKWRREFKEILVHCFDFLYFYGDDVKGYTSSIWSTWCAIPGIGDRIPEYIVRTLCAISPPYLRLPPQERRASVKEVLRQSLVEISGTNAIASTYATQALHYLDQEWTNGTQRVIEARIYLVKLAVGFLFSDSVSALLFQDSRISGGTGSGYTKKFCVYDDVAVENPLRFAQSTITANSKEAESLWLLHNIAFCCKSRGGL